jgi:hypothetical protein
MGTFRNHARARLDREGIVVKVDAVVLVLRHTNLDTKFYATIFVNTLPATSVRR